MKTHLFSFFFLCFFLLTFPVVSQAQSDFQTWSNSLYFAQVRAMYDSAHNFMTDARQLSPSSIMMPFSFRDSITKKMPDTINSYPYTFSEGLTSAYYKDSLIFQNTWNYGYMDQARSITTIKYGALGDIKCLKIKNESHFPPNQYWPDGYYGRENRVFIEISGALEEINLQNLGGAYYLYDIKACSRQNVIMLYSTDFVRSSPNYLRIVLLDLRTKEKKVFIYNSANNDSIRTSTGIGLNDNLKPNQFFLEQNYPNPFNPNTTIHYSLPHESFVSLKIYSALGEEVGVVVNEVKSAGNHSANFNGQELKSGMYICRLSAGNKSDTKKMVLLK